MIPSYLTSEITNQWAAEARERGERSRLAAVATKAARERRRAEKSAAKEGQAKEKRANEGPAGNAEPGTAMSC